MYLDTTVSVEPSSLKLDSDYSLIYEYIIDDINCSCFEMPYCHGFCNNDHICNCLKSYWSVVAFIPECSNTFPVRAGVAKFRQA